jgi:2,4-dichlorophenol 6-monooxygenase
MRAAVGVPDLPVEPRKPSRWHVESVVADRFADGRAFLLGDAAHRHPPTGALGLNTAVQDAHNLAWKLAMVLRAEAAPALLDTYETERRPVAVHNAKESLESFFAHTAIDEAIGITPDSPQDGWKAVQALLADVDGRGAARERLRAAVEIKGREFSALRRENGYRYAIAGGPPVEPDPDDDGCLFESSGQPGERVPHAWIDGPTGSLSTLGLIADDRLTLITGADGAAWRAAAEQSATPLRVVSLGDGSDYGDPTGDWRLRSGLASSGAMLVRPDHHIAWRATASVADPPTELARAIDSALGRTPVAPVPVAPSAA